jgi:hypothetical protein
MAKEKARLRIENDGLHGRNARLFLNDEDISSSVSRCEVVVDCTDANRAVLYLRPGRVLVGEVVVDVVSAGRTEGSGMWEWLREPRLSWIEYVAYSMIGSFVGGILRAAFF